MDLLTMQVRLPWTIRYSRDYRANPQTHKDFAHAVTHATKALGKLAALVDDMDHDREVADDPTLRERQEKYLADLVVCALRAANCFPGGAVDLERAVIDRIVEKNDVSRTEFAGEEDSDPAVTYEAINSLLDSYHAKIEMTAAEVAATEQERDDLPWVVEGRRFSTYTNARTWADAQQAGTSRRINPEWSPRI